MNTFNATITTDYGTYYIDLKPSKQYCLIRNDKGTYHETLQDALNLIGYYDDQAIEQALLQSELDHNS